MKLISYTQLACGLLLAVGSSLAHATPITGEINFDGTATTNTGSLATATAFTTISNTFVDPGTMTGNYSTVAPFTPVTFTPFSFSATSVTPLWTFTVAGVTYSFSATTINVTTQTSTFLNLSGLGTASITGFDATPGTWSITDTGSGPNFTFGAGTTTVPDGGATALLIVLGLAGVGVAMYTRRDLLVKA